MNFILCLTLVFVDLFCAATIHVPDLPDSATKLREQFSESQRKVREQHETEISTFRRDFLDKARAQVTKLTNDGKLNEALQIRELMKALEASADSKRDLEVLDSHILNPESGLTAEYREVRKKLVDANREVAKRLARLIDDHKSEMEKLARQLETQGDRDSAQAFADYFKSLPEKTILNGIDLRAARTVPEFPKDFLKASLLYNSTTGAWRQQLDELGKSKVTDVIVELIRIQEELTKAGDLEKAVVVRDFVQMTQTFRHPDQISGLFSNLPPKLPVEASELCKKHKDAWDAETRFLMNSYAELSKAFSECYRPELRSKLEKAPFQEASLWLMQYYTLKQEQPTWLPGTLNPTEPELGLVARALVDKFNDDTSNRMKELDKKEGELRSALFTARKRVSEQDGEKFKASLEILDTWLEANYAQQLRGALVFPEPLMLPESLSREAKLYRDGSIELLKIAREEYQSGLHELEQELQPIRSSHAQEEEFEKAYAILLKLNHLEHHWPPYRIYAQSGGGLGNYSEAFLWDLRDEEYLISRTESQPAIEWLPKSKVALYPDDLPETEARWKFPLGPVPEIHEKLRVDHRSPLKPGDKLACYLHLQWKPVEVTNLTPFGAEVRTGPGVFGKQLIPFPYLKRID